ncbi:hypothetical protein [Spirosoma aerophilum]
MILRKPHLISWLAIPALVLIGLWFRQHTVDVQLYDTYYVIDNGHFALAESAFLLVAGLGYWFLQRTGKTPNGALTAVHLLPTIGLFMLLVLPISGRGNSISDQGLLLGLAAFLLGQCAYVVNILITSLRK